MSEKTCTVCGRAAAGADSRGRCASCAEQLRSRHRLGLATPTESLGDAAEASAAAPGADPLVGRELGACRLLERVGGGGMGVVYRAEQLSLGRIVAVKVLHPEQAANPTFVARLRGEARAIAALNHPHILQIYDIGSAGALHFILMEFVEGPSLGDLLFQGFHREPARGKPLLIQTLSGLAHAHERGIIHRDLKPDNLLLAGGVHVKIADFGLAKVLDASPGLTATGVVLGTPLYMSPEAAYGRPLDRRSDLYSLGATFYHALSGTPPFSGETAMGILYRHIHDSLTPLHEVNPAVDRQLSAILGRLLAKEPDERYSSAEQVLEALGAPGVAHAAAPPASRSRIAVRRPSSGELRAVEPPAAARPAEPARAAGPDADPHRTLFLEREAEPAPVVREAPPTVQLEPLRVVHRRRRRLALLVLLAGVGLFLAATAPGRQLVHSIAPGLLRLLRSAANLESPVRTDPAALTPAPVDGGAAAEPSPSAAVAPAVPPGVAGSPAPAVEPTAAATPAPTPVAEPTAASPADEAAVRLADDLLAQFAEESNSDALEQLGAAIETLAERAPAEQAIRIRQRLVYLRFLRLRERVRELLARGKPDEARIALETFRRQHPESAWSDEVRRLHEALERSLAGPGSPALAEAAALQQKGADFLELVRAEQWSALGRAFPSRNCRSSGRADLRRIARSVFRVLRIPQGSRVEDYQIEAVRVDPDATNGWIRVSLRLQGRAAPHQTSLLWLKNCGEWRLDTAPID